MQEQDGVTLDSAAGVSALDEPPSLTQDPTFLQNEERREQDGVTSDTVRLSEPSLCRVRDSAATKHFIPDKPNHPILQFPLRIFGKQRRSFCSSWYQRYPWLHYQVASDTVLCYHCHVAERRNLPVSTGNKDQAFISVGFSNWKKAIECFGKHEKSASYHQAVDLVEKIPQTVMNVGDMLSSAHAQQKSENREMLKIILSSIQFLARQGLALRGRYKTGDEDLGISGGEPDSNFIQLLKLCAQDNSKLVQWMERSQDKFTSLDIQNEILSIMATTIQREIAREVSGKWYTVMVDETTDISNTEQMVFCLRYVDNCLEVHWVAQS